VKPRVTYVQSGYGSGYRAPSYGAYVPPRTTYVAPRRTTVVVVKSPRVYYAPVTEKCTPAVYNPTYNAYTPGGSYSYQYKRYIAGYCSPASKARTGRSSYYKPVVVRKRITSLRLNSLCSANRECRSGCCTFNSNKRTKVKKTRYNTKYRKRTIYYTTVRSRNTYCRQSCIRTVNESGNVVGIIIGLLICGVCIFLIVKFKPSGDVIIVEEHHDGYEPEHVIIEEHHDPYQQDHYG